MNKKSFCLGFALLTAVVSANADTPYSMYGYGVISERATSMQRQMGGVGYAMQSGRQINAMNPASYASIDSLTFLWDMGATMSTQWSRDDTGKMRTFGGGLDYMTMQFPLSKHMGMSVGLVPFTQVGYSFGNEIKYGARENQGNGGITQAYAGVAGKIGGLSVGLNVSYDFGTIQNDVYTSTTSINQALFEHIMQVRDWNVLLGIQYKQPISKFNYITAGMTYAPKKSFHGNTWMTLQNLTSTETPDTVVYSSMKGKYYSPTSLGFGVAFTHEKVHRLNVELDFSWQQWSKAPFSSLYDSDGKEVFVGTAFSNRSKVSAGAEYIHNVRGSYVERIPLRVGGFYTHDYLTIRGNNVKEYGVTLGVGFPAPKGKTMINLGFEWRHRNSYPVNLLTENYLNIMVGVNFNEVWFFKRKLN